MISIPKSMSSPNNMSAVISYAELKAVKSNYSSSLKKLSRGSTWCSGWPKLRRACARLSRFGVLSCLPVGLLHQSSLEHTTFLDGAQQQKVCGIARSGMFCGLQTDNSLLTLAKDSAPDIYETPELTDDNSTAPVRYPLNTMSNH